MKKTAFWLSLIITAIFANSAFALQVTPEQKERIDNFLSMDLYVYETKLVGTPEEFQKSLSDHLDYQVMLENTGIMFAAGPLAEEGQSPNSGAGLIIIRAKSFEDAKAIADADPFHARGIRTYQLRKWTLNEGSFDFTIRVSDQNVKIK